MIVRIKSPTEKILPHCWAQVNTRCSPDFSMSKARHSGQAYPRIYLFQCFSPSPVSTTFFHKAPYLFYHHPCPSARFERTLAAFVSQQQTRFGVQFHSQDNHCLFREVSLIFINHRNPALSLLPPPHPIFDVRCLQRI